jgi:hypothetical protein
LYYDFNNSNPGAVDQLERQIQAPMPTGDMANGHDQINYQSRDLASPYHVAIYRYTADPSVPETSSLLSLVFSNIQPSYALPVRPLCGAYACISGRYTFFP